MSLILEALRKSEAERRRGQAPDVLTDMPAAQSAAKRTLPAWAWIVPVAVLVLATLWWWQRDPQPSSPLANSIAADTATLSAEQPHTAALPPVPRLTSPPVQRVRQTVAAAIPAANDRAQATIDPSPAASQDATQAQIPARPAAVQPESTQSPTTAATPTTLPSAPATAMPTPPSKPGGVRKPEPNIVDTAPPPGERVESLSDLSSADRQALPPLKLSMHLWNADPARRFVIVDGNRVGEGDRVGDAVVRSITRDSVVLDWNGRRIKLPVR